MNKIIKDVRNSATPLTEYSDENIMAAWTEYSRMYAPFIPLVDDFTECVSTSPLDLVRKNSS